MSRTAIEDPSGIIDILKLRPIQDYILMKVLEKEKTAGGIYLPKNKATECTMGEVISTGTGILNTKNGGSFPFELVKGDHVLTMDYMGERMELRNGEYRFVRSNGVWAKLIFKNQKTYEIENIFPRFDSVVVEPRDETMTMTGLVYFGNKENRECPNRLATVTHIGPGRWNSDTGNREPCTVKPGDEVVIMRYAGAIIQVKGRTLRILQEDDIRCIREEN